VTAFLVLVVLLVAAVWIIHYLAERALAQRIAAIRARGEPVTIEDLIARRRTVPDEDNMFVTFSTAAKTLESIKLTDEESRILPYLGSHSPRPPTGELCDTSALKVSKQYLSRVDGAVHDLHVALKLRHSYFIVNWTTPAINALLPSLPEIRMASKVLALEVITTAQNQDREITRRCLREMTSLMRLMDGDEVLISALIQIALSSMVQDCIEQCINYCGLDDQALIELRTALSEAESHPNLKHAFMAERVGILDTLQWLRADKVVASLPESIEERLHARPPGWRYIPVVPVLDVTAGLDLLTGMADAVDQSDVRSIQKMSIIDDAITRLPKYCIMSKILIWPLSRSVVLWARNVGQNRALRAAIAAERFRLAKGRWPDKLDDLVPAFIDAVPKDPIDGKPIRYAIIPEGIKTWTISDDDKNEDNGGDVKRLERRSAKGPNERPKDYGWVILNPSLRGRPAPTTSASSTSAPASRPGK